VWFVIDHGRRRIIDFNVTTNPARRKIGRLGRLGWSILALWGLGAAIGGLAISLGLV
jgi:hypothetical protein